MHILVVEDEQAIADFVCRGLAAEGYAVSWAQDGLAGEAQALADDPDLVVLDILLPKKSGLEVLQSIREKKPTLPVVLLSALGETEQKIEGLDRGATDYVTKPFSLAELAARIRTHLRTPQQQESTKLSVAGLGLDFKTRKVACDGVEVPLSAREFDLLAHLMRHPNQVLSRQQLLNSVWGYNHDPGTNVVEVYIGYLRRKLPEAGSKLIETVRSVGYRLAA